MKVFVDAMCAEFGGIRTYVEHLLGGWHELHPEDEVHVALRAGSTLPTPGLVRHELPVRRPDVLGRPWAQATAMHRLVRRERPDVVLATAPTTDPRRIGAPLAVVILDLRAEILPDQFSRARRLLRWASYGRSYRLAAGFLAISQRSLDDLHRLHPDTTRVPGVVAHLGADHVLGWPAPSRTGPAVAFAHHTNKNPELLLHGWAELVRRGHELELLLLGVSGGLRDTLTGLIEQLDLGRLVRLAPFLDHGEFEATFAAASMVAFPSAFEGFGLPIVEAMLLDKPVVIGPDAGSMEVAGGFASTMAAWTAEAFADAAEDALARDPAALRSAHEWAAGFTWLHTISTTRDALSRLAGPARDRTARG